MDKIISITSHRGYLVAVCANGSVWVGDGDLFSPDFVWKCVQV